MNATFVQFGLKARIPRINGLTARRGSMNFWWDDMDEEKISMGPGAAVGPQRGPDAEPLVGVKGAKPPCESNAFFTNYTVILHFLNSAVR
jgi:hypothetical protein